MTAVVVESDVDRFARMQATIDAMQTELDGLRAIVEHSPRHISWRRSSALLGAVVLAGAMVTGIAGAAAPGNPADVTYIALTVPHKVLSNASIGKAATNSPVVVGGSTTVPSDATSVQMTVLVKSTVAGTLSVFPTDNPASTTADTISFPAGSVVASQVTRQSPGLSGKVSFKNNGTAGATVTVTITGYSTQTTASDISGSGGSAGQVLTNTGSGADWEVSSSAIAASNPNVHGVQSSYTPLSIMVPAGSYWLSFTGSMDSFTGSSTLFCQILAPDNGVVAQTSTTSSSTSPIAISAEGLMDTTGGQVSVTCLDVGAGVPEISRSALVALKVGQVSGAVTH